MPIKDDGLHIEHVLECIDRVQTYTRGGREEFFTDIQKQDAVLRNLQVLAESSQRLSDALRARHSEIDWRSLSGFRNVLVHEYFGIRLERVWQIVEEDLPELKLHMETIRGELGDDRP